MEIINQNESLNQMFDSTAALYKETEANFRLQTLTTYSEERKEIYESQKSYLSYLFSLLEDIHRYSYFSLCEVYLYEHQLAHKDDRTFFSSNYFLRNASFHIIGAWERTFRLSSLIYGFDFSGDNWDRSRTLYDFLKSTDSFNTSEIYHLIKELKSNGHLPEIEKLRIRNDHQLSMHVDYETDDELMKHARSSYENAKTLYKIVHLYILKFQNECFLQTRKVDLKKFSWKKKIDSPEHLERTVSSEFERNLLRARLERCSIYINEGIEIFINFRPIINPFLTLKNETSKYILQHSDIVWRLHEAIRSLQYSYNLIVSSYRKETELYEQEIYFRNMDYSYFIESAVTRIYSVYDKIAILLHLHTGGGKANNTFEQFMRNNTEVVKNSEFFDLASNIYERKEYKELNNLRQDNLHHMVKENFIHKVDSEWSNLYNMILASKNIEILKPLFKKVIDLFIDDPVGFKVSQD